MERRPFARICLIDKETELGRHASGRNSGVLHAGFYYSPDSIKARLTAAGATWLAKYCETRNLPLRRLGKLVVTRSEAELPALDMLLARGVANGVDVQVVNAHRAAELEPLARTHVAALWSPRTAVGDPGAVLASLAADATSAGIALTLGGPPITGLDVSRSDCVRLTARDGRVVATAMHAINAAGAFADRLAHSAGHGAGLACVPFRGAYLYSDIPLTRLVYPVPDSRAAAAFLGVHWTVTTSGQTKIGPTAMPVLWREAYGDVGQRAGGFDAIELCQQVALQARLLAGNAPIRALAIEQARLLSRTALIREAAVLVPAATESRFTKMGRAGIRAQLVRTDTMALELDFVVHSDARTTHILNAVSPGWTASRGVAEHVVAGILRNT